MKILVTGSKGFIGKNLVENFKNVKEGKDKSRDVVIDEIFEFDVDSDLSKLDDYCSKCDFVFNLAGINRPENTEEDVEAKLESLAKVSYIYHKKLSDIVEKNKLKKILRKKAAKNLDVKNKGE